MTGSLHQLSPAARSVLRVAALIGPAFDFDTLRAALDQPADDVLTALEEAAAAAIIHEHSDQFRFATPQVADSLRADLLGPRRAAWHRRIAAVARDPDVVAYHLGAAGDPAAVPLLKAAGDRAMRVGARARAAGCYQRALELCGDSHALRAELLLLAGAALELADAGLAASLSAAAALAASAGGDDVVAAMARYAQALHLAAEGNARALTEVDRAHQTLVLLWREPRLVELQALIFGEPSRQRGVPDGLALVYLASGRPAEAEAVVREALAAVGPHPSFYDHWVLGETALLRGELAAAYQEHRLAAEDALRRRCFGTAAARLAYLLGHMRRHRHAEPQAVATIAAVAERLAQVRSLAAAVGERIPGDDGAADLPALPAGGPGSPPRLGDYHLMMEAMTAGARAMRLAGDLPAARAWLETVDAWQAGARPSPWNHALNQAEWVQWHRAAQAPPPPPTPPSPPGKRGPGGLTEREAEVVRLVAEGLTDREIAGRLTISPRTVDGHLRNIFNKLDLASRTRLVVWAVRNGLADT